MKEKPCTIKNLKQQDISEIKRKELIMKEVFGFLVQSLAMTITFIVVGCFSGIVFYFVYNPLADKWLYFLPAQLRVVGFWESIGLFILTSLIGVLIQNVVPSICKKK